MIKKKLSAVVQFLDLAWGNANAATPGHSWERLNTTMHAALKLAITAGFPFGADDLTHIWESYSTGRWIGCNGYEPFYSLAIEAYNTSFVKSFETWAEREPFIADNVTIGNSRYSDCSAPDRQKERLHVGAKFTWKGERVTVTSFAKDGGSLTACSYPAKQEPATCKECGLSKWENDGFRKPKKRYAITREAIIEDRAERKERDGLHKELTTLCTDGVTTAHDVLDMLGVKTKEEFATLPIKKIRAVLDKVKEASS